MNVPPYLIVMFGISTVGVLSACAITSFQKKQSAALRHSIWLLAVITPLIVAAFLPWGMQFPVPILPPKQSQLILSRASDFSRLDDSLTGRAANGLKGTALEQSQQQQNAPKAPQSAASTAIRSFWLAWNVNGYLLIGLIGFSCVISKMIFDQRQIIFFLREQSSSVPAEVKQLAETIRAKMGMRLRPSLRMALPSQVPFCYGVLRPVVVLPATRDLERQSVYLKHEFAHIVRRDLLWIFLGQLACALCWFNPLIWMALGKMRRESEYVADDLVLSCDTEPASYAFTILDLVQTCRTEQRASILAMAHPEGLPRRIECIMDSSIRRQIPSSTFLAAQTLLTTFLVFCLICVRLVAAESAYSPTAAPNKPPFPSGSLAIRVVDENNMPVAGALISPDVIFSCNGSTYWINPNKTTHDIVTDSNGQANLPYVLDDTYERPPGDLIRFPVAAISVHVSSQTHALARSTLSVSAVKPEIVLQKGTAVTLRAIGSDGVALPNVSVLIDGNQNLWDYKWHSSPDTTSITSDPLPSGDYIFRIFTRNSSGSLSFSDLINVRLVKGQAEAKYQLPVKPARSVSGVLDATVPRPVRHGFVIAYVAPRPPKEDGQPYEEPNWTTHAEIADNGTFVLKNLPDGVINLTSFCDGFISKPSSDFNYCGIRPQVFPDTKEQPLTVMMQPTGSLRVHLVSRSGASVQGMKVKAYVTEWMSYGTSNQLGCTYDSLPCSLYLQGISAHDATDYDYSSCYAVTTDANGEAVIPNLPIGEGQRFGIQNAKGLYLVGGKASVTVPASTVIYDVDSGKVIRSLTPDPSTPPTKSSAPKTMTKAISPSSADTDTNPKTADGL